jgi:hypothetical protein
LIAGRRGRAARDPRPPGRAALPYGWVVVAALSVTETVTWGIVAHARPGARRRPPRPVRDLAPDGAAMAATLYPSVFTAMATSLVAAAIAVFAAGADASSARAPL